MGGIGVMHFSTHFLSTDLTDLGITQIDFPEYLFSTTFTI